MSLRNLVEGHVAESLDSDRNDPNWQARREAFDVSLEAHGQAEWQHARRENPELFWSAKARIDAGPEGLWIDVARDMLDGYRSIRFRFGWEQDGKRWQLNEIVSIDMLSGDVTHLPEDGALRHMLRSAARQIAEASKEATSFSVRSNREALTEMRLREEQKQKRRPNP